MRVSQIMLAKGFGGAERSFVDTAVALAERGHQVQAICHHRFGHQHLLRGIRNLQVDTVHVRGWWDWRAVVQIAAALNAFGPIVAHTQLARAAWLGAKAARRAGIPVVAKMHNYAKLGYYRYVDHFVGTTADQRRYLLGHGIDDGRISVIPNFSRIAPVREIPRSDSDDVVFVAFGRFVPEKAYDILLSAFAEVRQEGRRVRLLLGGDGPLREQLKRQCRRLGLDDAVEWTGWVSDVPALLARGNVFVLSSRSESFGIVLLESMARGLPIISTRTKGPSQVLRDDTAWFAEPEDVASLADAMRVAADHPAQRAKKAAAALEHYRHSYHDSVVIPQLLALYEHLAGHVERAAA